jgi:hypothetical protein
VWRDVTAAGYTDIGAGLALLSEQLTSPPMDRRAFPPVIVLVSGSESHQTAPLGLSFFAGAARAGDPTKVAAAAVLVALPILVVYLFLQRHFVRGMLAGALKE